LLAGWGSRVGAQLIDGLIVFVIATILMAPLGLLGALSADDASAGEVLALLGALLAAMAVVLLVALLYAPLLMARTNGQTLGRMAVGIRVVRAKGQPMTLAYAAYREVVVKGGIWFVSTVTFGLLWVVDVVWPLWDEENRALHDFLTDTRTVRA
jgi:uncharacterized RDD family membrane protein YckC